MSYHFRQTDSEDHTDYFKVRSHFMVKSWEGREQFLANHIELVNGDAIYLYLKESHTSEEINYSKIKTIC